MPLCFRVPTTGENQGKQNFVGKNPCREKSGNFEKMGKIREKSGNFTKTCQGNIREFSAIYILIVSPFSRIYIYIYPGKWGNYQEKIREKSGNLFHQIEWAP